MEKRKKKKDIKMNEKIRKIKENTGLGRFGFCFEKEKRFEKTRKSENKKQMSIYEWIL